MPVDQTKNRKLLEFGRYLQVRSSGGNWKKKNVRWPNLPRENMRQGLLQPGAQRSPVESPENVAGISVTEDSHWELTPKLGLAHLVGLHLSNSDRDPRTILSKSLKQTPSCWLNLRSSHQRETWAQGQWWPQCPGQLLGSRQIFREHGSGK